MTAEELDAELTARFIGDRSLHEAQAQALAHLSAGRARCAVMATGRGKSLIFHLHAARTALRHGRASVFVYPLRALVADQAFHLEEVFAEVGLAVRTVTGETSLPDRDEAFAELKAGTLDVVLTTPEFLHLYAERFAASGQGRLPGRRRGASRRHGARRAPARVRAPRRGGSSCSASRRCLPSPRPPTSTTAQSIRELLGVTAVVLDPTVRENLAVVDKRDAQDKDGYLAALVAKGGKTVIYVNSREQSVKLARMLQEARPGRGDADGVLQRRPGALGPTRGRACVSRQRGVRDRRDQRVRRGRQHPRHPQRRSLPPALQRRRVQPDVRPRGPGRRAGARPPAVRRSRRAHQRDDPVVARAQPRRHGGALRRPPRTGHRRGRGIRDHQRRARRALQEGPARSSRSTSGASPRRWASSATWGSSSARGTVRFVGSRSRPPRARSSWSRACATPRDSRRSAEFAQFKSWALTAESDELLARFNRPILPSAVH